MTSQTYGNSKIPTPYYWLVQLQRESWIIIILFRSTVSILFYLERGFNKKLLNDIIKKYYNWKMILTL